MAHTTSSNTTCSCFIFDLTGVVFAIKKYLVCKELGLWNMAYFCLKHRKNPVTFYLETMQALRQFDHADTPSIYYRGYAFPSCVADYYTGKKNSAQTLHELNTNIEKLAQKGFFKTKHEQRVLAQSINENFDSKKQAQVMQPIPTTIALIHKIKQANPAHKLLLLSNFDAETFHLLKAHYPVIFSLFDDTIISAEVGILKPYRPIYEHVITTYNLTPQKTLFIDDQHENLIEPTKLGMHTFLYTTSSLLKKHIHTYLEQF